MKNIGKYSLVIKGVIIVVVLVIVGFLLNVFFPTQMKPLVSFLGRILPQTDNRVVLRVGDEQIYQKDLDTELLYFPAQIREERKEFIMQKMINDSVILQAAAKDGLVTLDPTIFNSRGKDYLKRAQQVERVKGLIESKQDKVKGSVIAIWFYNMKPASIGYEQGKALAYAKISRLHASVKSSVVSIEQAGERIIFDNSIEQLDTAYKSNAIFHFESEFDQPIVFDKAFDAKIKDLKEGEVSEIVLIKDKERKDGEPTGNLIDAAYMFAQVKEKQMNGKYQSFDSWLNSQKGNYAVSYH